MKIKIRRKSQGEWTVLFILTMPFLFFMMMGLFGFPSLIKYTVDIGWCLLLFILLKSRRSFSHPQAKKLAVTIGLFFAISLIGAIINYQSLAYYVWGLRNNARFFVFFFGCIFYMQQTTADSILRIFDKIFWVNLIIVLYQYYVLGYSQDYLGGIFGVEKGCNAYMNIYLVIMTTKSLLLYMNGKTKAVPAMIIVAVCLVITVLSELKVYFIELVIITVLTTVFTKSSARKLWMIIGTTVGILLATQILGALFPVFADWFSLERIIQSASNSAGYTGRNDLNRLTAIPIVLERFLPSGFDKLFGLGLGNCDYASFDFLISPFYRQYAALNYTWFSSAFLVLETGLVGFAIYCTFFVMIFIYAGKKQKSEQGNQLHCQLARVMAVMSGVFVIYNSAMRTEAGFMAYFILTLPFLNSNKRKT